MDHKVSLMKFIKLLATKTKKDNIPEYAYCLTYNLLLSFFPFLIFLMTLISFANLDFSMLMTSSGTFLPREVYELILNIITETGEQQRSKLMSFSILLALYAASGGFRSIMEAANRVTASNEKRGILLQYVLSIFWVVLFSFAIISALLGIVFGQQILNRIKGFIPVVPDERLVDIFRIVLPLAFVFLLFLSVYMFVPSRQVCFRCALPGAVFTTVIWTVFTLLFQFYVNNYANYSLFYGTIGSVIILLVWLQLTSMILLIGMEINALFMDLEIIKPKGD